MIVRTVLKRLLPIAVALIAIAVSVVALRDLRATAGPGVAKTIKSLGFVLGGLLCSHAYWLNRWRGTIATVLLVCAVAMFLMAVTTRG